MSPSLEIKKNNCNKACGSRVVVGQVMDPNGLPVWAYARVYCKTWSCPYCGPKKARLITRRIGEVAKERDLSRFLTLTLDSKKIKGTVLDQIKHLRGTWRKFRVYMQREFDQTVPFIAVTELHKSGVPHLHVLLDRFIRQKWISRSWDALGGGKIVYIKQAKDLKKIGWVFRPIPATHFGSTRPPVSADSGHPFRPFRPPHQP